MNMHTIIRQKRLELGLTQEQVAERLGVTAPAVNKWEKGTTCPDIALVAPLARLLKTDVNTLLCFREDLTDQEIGQFCALVAETVQRDGFPAGSEQVFEKLRAYPACDKLTYSMAAYLEGALLFSGLSGEEREAYQARIDALYERAADSENQRIRSGALYVLASKAIQKKEYAKAEDLLGRLPEPDALDKRQLQANLLLAQCAPGAWSCWAFGSTGNMWHPWSWRWSEKTCGAPLPPWKIFLQPPCSPGIWGARPCIAAWRSNTGRSRPRPLGNRCFPACWHSWSTTRSSTSCGRMRGFSSCWSAMGPNIEKDRRASARRFLFWPAA